tara:strand:+ start:63365 stop:64552 length:1188 start_codon:yes stop_codon:yes gene_type:complete
MPNKLYSPTEMIETLISFNTTSYLSNMEMINFIKDYLELHGIESTLIPNETNRKANLLASIGPKELPGIVLSGHTDVVPVDGQDWLSDPFSVVERNGRLYGRGTADMKSFCAIALALIPKIVSRPLNIPIHFAFSYDEEVGCLGAPSMIKNLTNLPTQPMACIVGEPTNMEVVNAHKGVFGFHTTVKGFEQHSSATHLGVNAIQYSAKLISFLMQIGDQMRNDRIEPNSGFSPPYTTVHVGLISGGTAQNIIPKECTFSWEYRLVPGSDPDEIINRFQEYITESILPEMQYVYPKASIKTEAKTRAPNLIPNKESSLQELVLKLAQKNKTGVVSFGTEAGLFQSAGIPTVICGPGSINEAHKPNEFIELSQIKECNDFLVRLLEFCRNTKLYETY